MRADPGVREASARRLLGYLCGAAPCVRAAWGAPRVGGPRARLCGRYGGHSREGRNRAGTGHGG
jgi:hypothetical protein